MWRAERERCLHAATVAHARVNQMRATRAWRRAGRSAAVFDEIYPALHLWTTGFDPAESPLELGARALAGRLNYRLMRNRDRLHASYSAAMRRAFVEGYRSGAACGRS